MLHTQNCFAYALKAVGGSGWGEVCAAGDGEWQNHAADQSVGKQLFLLNPRSVGSAAAKCHLKMSASQRNGLLGCTRRRQ